jgi:hypothetical protein
MSELFIFVSALTAILAIIFAIGRRFGAFGLMIFTFGNELMVEGIFFEHVVTVLAGMLVCLVGGIMYLARPRKPDYSKQVQDCIAYRERVD